MSEITLLNRNCKEWTGDEYKQLVQQYEDGLSLGEIAKFHKKDIYRVFQGIYGCVPEAEWIKSEHKVEFEEYKKTYSAMRKLEISKYDNGEQAISSLCNEIFVLREKLRKLEFDKVGIVYH